VDITSVVGVLLAFALIIGSIIMAGAAFGAFIDIPSGAVVIGGAIAATLMCFPLKVILTAPKVFLKCVFNKAPDTLILIQLLVSLAETARRDGLLALEGRMDEIDDNFIMLGIQMAVDGTRPDAMEDIMRNELDAIATRHRTGKGMLDQGGRFAPAFGMIGTLMGLIIMLQDMSDPSAIGAGMAVALITTLYGAILSNAILLPYAEKLSFISKQELLAKEITIRGILAIQSGENPRVIEQKLNTFLPPKLRPVEEKEAA